MWGQESVLVLAGSLLALALALDLLRSLATTADSRSRTNTGGSTARPTATLGLLVGLLGHLEHSRERLALVRLHRLLDVGHPRTALATLGRLGRLGRLGHLGRLERSINGFVGHFIQQARKILNAGPLVFHGTRPPCGHTDSTGIPVAWGYPTFHSLFAPLSQGRPV